VNQSITLSALLFLSATCALAQSSPIEYPGGRGPGRGKHVVLIAGDQEYRSEESIPALAQILSARHGFRCTVIFPVNRQTGRLDPNTIDNLPGLEALRRADLVVLFARWLELPDDQMKEIVDYTESGRPLVALRTSTHPFNYQKHPESKYAKFSYNSKDPSGGYVRQVLGETWIAHYGAHQKQSTRGVVVPGMERHPILRGVRDLWGESDVYEIRGLFGDSLPLVMGQVLMGMDPASQPDPAKKLMPVAWTKTYTGASGRKSRIFTTTMGHVMDFQNQGFRRMMVNACYWAIGLEKKIDATSSVEFVEPFKPSPIGVRRAAQ